MSEEEQIERMKRNQERLANRKKSSLSSPGSQRQSQSQGSETREEVCQNWITTLYHRLKYIHLWVFLIPSATLPSKGNTSGNSRAAIVAGGQKGFCWRPSTRAQ